MAMKKPNPNETFPSEVSKYRHLTNQFCIGNGCDIGSGGDGIVPWAINIELPEKEYNLYNSNQKPRGPLHYRAIDAIFNPPFKPNTLDWVALSHVIEDWSQEVWPKFLGEWVKCLKPGGRLIILVPDYLRWKYAIEVLGQPCNCAHFSPEPSVGDLTKVFTKLGLRTICDKLTDCHPNDYSILGVAKKPGSPNSIPRRVG